MKRQDPSELIMDLLESCESREGLSDVANATRDLLKTDHVAFHWADTSESQALYGTYSQDWKERYFSLGYARTDPVVLGCYRSFRPVDWKALDWSSKAARAYLKEAIEWGLGNQGFSVPLRGPLGQFAIFTVSHSCDDKKWAQFCRTHQRKLILIAHHFNQKALEFEPDRESMHIQNLSPREVEVIALLASGSNRAQISDSLSISEHTVRVYLESARLKLGATNATHAVARALSRGLVRV